MPVSLNGKYYGMQETAKLLGLNYVGLSRILKPRKDVIRFGKVRLIPEWVLNELASTYGRGAKPLDSVAKMLGTTCQEVEAIVAAGFPSVMDSRGADAISIEDLPFLQAAYSRVVAAEKFSEKERPEVVAKLALKLMASLEGEIQDA